MSKAILVLDEMPESCVCCPCYKLNRNGFFVCDATLDRNKLTTNDIMLNKPDWCPLKEVPKEKGKTINLGLHEIIFNDGWDACLNEILGK